MHGDAVAKRLNPSGDRGRAVPMWRLPVAPPPAHEAGLGRAAVRPFLCNPRRPPLAMGGEPHERPREPDTDLGCRAARTGRL